MWKDTGIPIASQYIHDDTCQDDCGPKCMTIKMHNCESLLPLEAVNCNDAVCYPACSTYMFNKQVEGKYFALSFYHWKFSIAMILHFILVL